MNFNDGAKPALLPDFAPPSAVYGGESLIEWTSSINDSDVRCPYCVENGNFRQMLRQLNGEWFFCNGCGHLALPSIPLYRCTCGKCASLYTPVENRTMARRVQFTLRRFFSSSSLRRSGSGRTDR